MLERALRGAESACPDPGDLLALVGARADAVFYWEQPARGLAIAAVGAVREIRAAGAERFAVAARAARTLLASIIAPRRGAWGGAHVVGGFGFSDASARDPAWREFPALRLVVPEFLWMRRGGVCRLTRVWEAGREAEHEARLAALVAGIAASPPGDDRRGDVRPRAAATEDERRRWTARVAEVQALIASGAARKVVLARRRDLRLDGVLDPAAVLARARATRPSCVTFAVRHAGTTFLGSTPELLARRRGADVDASALAGSGMRGVTAEEDRRLGAALLACAKNAGEHAHVVAAVRAALERVASDVAVPARPELLRLPEAQHLHTALRARLTRPLTALEVAGLLHPTPAVCGVPLDVARRLIERSEPDRGWYTGAVGWMDAGGDGEFAVALRSALCDADRVTIRAGAGIVAGSNADAELAETEAKMTALFRDVAGRADDRAA